MVMLGSGVKTNGGLTVLEEGTLVENKRITALTSAELADRYGTLAELIGDISMVERFLVQFRETFSNARSVFVPALARCRAAL